MRRILYLHGFASGPASQKAQYLRERLRAHGLEPEVPDLSEGNLEALTITGQLGVIGRLAGGDAVSLIGSSMGGYLAALYAARHPEVDRVVLLAPAFGFARHFTESLGPAQMDEWRIAGWLPVHNYAAGRPARIGYGLVEDGMRYEEFPAVTQPTLIFHGTRDDVVPCRLSEEFAGARPNVRLELVDSDHQMLSVLDRIGNGVCDFITEP